MKKHLLGICLAALACVPMFGALVQDHHSSSSSEQEQPVDLANASARDTTLFPLTTSFKEIPFSQNLEIHGTGITAISDREFELDVGVYLVTYSGTVEVDPASSDSTVFFNYSLNLGSSQVVEFDDSADANGDTHKLKSFTVEFPVPFPSVLSIQARIAPFPSNSDPDNDIAAIGPRAIGIVKLS